ncbi:MAG: hypothetical protein H6867_07370 [Rhodospirillales bacterium]|nr:hypothetical protein [Rhodospirillales bacterium]MCB9995371.1 hypothetical protein [Rhodospirillales bacterium]
MNSQLATLGALLALLGSAVLLFLGVLCFMVVTAPQDVTLVQFVLEHVRAGDTAIYGHMTDVATGRKMDFQLNWSESVRTISFLFLGVAILGVLAGISKIMISSGVSLMKTASSRSEAGRSEAGE